MLSHQVQFSEASILSSEWDMEKARQNYEQLVNRSDVNLIISLGVLSSGVVVENQVFPKPVIAVGIIDTEVQNMGTPVNNRSNIHNLTYILFNRSLKRDIDAFYEVYPFL